MDPYSAAFSAIGSAAAGGPSAAHSGTSGDSRLYQDGSGWTVSTSRGQATGATIVRSGEEGATGSALAAGLAGGFDITTLAMIALVAVIALKVLRK